MIEYKHLKRAKTLKKLQKAFSNLLYCFVIFHNVLFSGKTLLSYERAFSFCPKYVKSKFSIICRLLININNFVTLLLLYMV